MKLHIKYSSSSPKDLALDRGSLVVTERLYRTNTSLVQVCKELGISTDNVDLGDLETCTHCGVWWRSYELTPDLDDNNICRFCEGYYGE